MCRFLLMFLTACLAAFCPVARAQTVPTLLEPIEDVVSTESRASVTIDLSEVFGLPDVQGTIVQMTTTRGVLNIELFDTEVPVTVENFLSYVEDGDFDNSILHRRAENRIYGGRYRLPLTGTPRLPREITPGDPIPYEASPSNEAGTIAMDPPDGDINGATSQWFFNTANNAALDGTHAVFGRVIGTGTSVLYGSSGITSLSTTSMDSDPDKELDFVPVVNYTSGNAVAASNLVRATSARRATIHPEEEDGVEASVLSYSAVSSNPSAVTASVDGSHLILEFPSPSPGSATVTVTATDSNGSTAKNEFQVTVVQGVTDNDSFSSPTNLTGSSATATGYNSGGSRESGEPNHAGQSGGASLWYTWTAPATGTAVVDTHGSDFDTVLAVYVGDALRSLRLVAANDNADGRETSKVQFAAVNGTTYRIAVDGRNGETGQVQLSIKFTSLPEAVTPGVYHGLVLSDNPSFDATGTVRITVGGGKSFSAQVRTGKRTYRFRGRFDHENRFYKRIKGGSNPMFVLLTAGADSKITGSLSSNTLAASIEAELSSESFVLPEAPEGASRLTFSIAGAQSSNGASPTPTATPGSPTPPSRRPDPVPEGNGYGVGTLRTNGALHLTGRLGDNAPFSYSSRITINSRVPFFVTPHRKKGVAAGWVTLVSGTGSGGSGTLQWFKKEDDSTDNYKKGYQVSTSMTLSSYTRPAPGERFLSTPDQLENLTFTFAGSNLRRPIDPIRATLRLDNKVIPHGRMSFSLNQSNGLFKGKFRERTAFRDREFRGVIVQSAQEGRGLFEARSQTGSVVVAAAAAGPAPTPTPTPTATATPTPTPSPTTTPLPTPVIILP
jgi:cyclophilin family peptidyl-prolyl cis-trans isomerase